MQDVDRSPGENEATDAGEASLVAEETDPFADDIQEATNLGPDSGNGLGSSCIVRVVIGSGDVGIEEVVSNQDLGHVAAAESFSVPEVLQQTQLVTEAYESSMDMEGVVENISESKT